MLAFPIAEEGEAFCRFQTLPDGTAFLLFRQDGRDRRDLVVVTEPEREQYVLLDSFLSGGSFREYLADSMERYQGRICLYLRAQAYRFPLPCPDGRGQPIPITEQEHGFQYSEALCCLWRISLQPDPVVELSDSERSLREKYRIAQALGVPLLIAAERTLDIVKAPCEQGA